MARQTLDQWITEVLTDDELKKQYGKCTRIALVHIAGRDNEVYTVSIPGKQWNPKDLADLFRKKAENHAGDLPGTQTFNLLAFFEDRSEPQARRAFPIQGGPDVGESQYLTEAPDAKGIVAQSMRHNEAYTKITLAHTSAMVDSCTRTINQLSTLLSMQMNENREMFSLLRESAMKQIADNNEHELKKMKLGQSIETRSNLTKLLPALVNGFTGKEIFPQHMEDTAIVEGMAEHLSEQDLMLLRNVLKPELMALVTKRMTRIVENKAKARQQAEIAMNGVDVEDAELSGSH